MITLYSYRGCKKGKEWKNGRKVHKKLFAPLALLFWYGKSGVFLFLFAGSAFLNPNRSLDPGSVFSLTICTIRSNDRFRFNPNRSLDTEQISLDCWADSWLWVRRRSGLRRERTINKMPTRKWKMTGSYLLYNDLHYNGLMTDLGWNTSGGCKRTFSSRVRVRAPSLRFCTFCFHNLHKRASRLPKSRGEWSQLFDVDWLRF